MGKIKDTYINVDKDIDQSNSSVKSKKNNSLTVVKQDRQLANKNLFKNAVKTGTVLAVTSILSRIVTQQLNSNSLVVSRLESQTNEFNSNVNNIPSNQSEIKRNNILKAIYETERALGQVNRLLNTISTIANILLIIVRILKVLVNIAPLPAAKANIKIQLDKIERILSSILVIVSTAITVINGLLAILATLKLLLSQQNQLGGTMPLGILPGVEYKGFRFNIKQENNPKFVVQGNKRHYAIAINKDGNDVLFSSYSFTLDPDVLVSELKLEIDRKGLQG